MPLHNNCKIGKPQSNKNIYLQFVIAVANNLNLLVILYHYLKKKILIDCAKAIRKIAVAVCRWVLRAVNKHFLNKRKINKLIRLTSSDLIQALYFHD